MGQRQSSLTIHHLVATPLLSGPTGRLLPIARAQRDLGHRVFLHLDASRTSLGGGYEESFPVDSLGLLEDRTHSLHLRNTGNLMMALRDARTLQRIGASADIVHTHTSHDHTLCALSQVRRGTTLIRSIHQSRALSSNPLRALLLRYADGYVAHLRDHAESIAERTRRPVHLARAYALPQFRGNRDMRASVRQELGIPQDAPVLLMSAHMDGRGHVQVLDALKGLEGAPHLVLLGDGPDASALRSQVAQLGLTRRVHLRGHVPQSDIPPYYAAADIFVLGKPGNDIAQRGIEEALSAGLILVGVRAWSPILQDWSDEEIIKAENEHGLVTSLRQSLQKQSRARTDILTRPGLPTAEEEARAQIAFYRKVAGYREAAEPQ